MSVAGITAASLLAATILCSACSSAGDPLACSDPPRISDYGINLVIRDSATNAYAARGATAIARDGAYYDSVTVPLAGFDQQSVGLARNRIGVYSVTVRKTGYLDWIKTGIQVGADVCGINDLLFTAKLQPRTQ